jgi:hypothetical protein
MQEKNEHNARILKKKRSFDMKEKWNQEKDEKDDELLCMTMKLPLFTSEISPKSEIKYNFFENQMLLEVFGHHKFFKTKNCQVSIFEF